MISVSVANIGDQETTADSQLEGYIKTMKDFYLTLMSDSSLNTFPNNTQSSFTVRLDHPINIEKENWEVALV